MKTWLLSICSFTLLTSCKSLSPYDLDDSNSTQWLMLSFGSFSNSSRTIATEREIVTESYERINSGRRTGESKLKEQKRITLLPDVGERFWRQVDAMELSSWSNGDIPPWTNRPSITYRKANKEVSFHSTGLDQPRDKRFEELLELIGQLTKCPAT